MSWNKDNYHKTIYGVRDIRPAQKNGDWSINTFRYIIDSEDHSEWADLAFHICYVALLNGKRWPDAPYAMEWIRADDQYRMSRDCFIYFYSCALFLNHAYIGRIKEIKPPFKIYRPTLTTWRRYLIKRTKLNKQIYLFWERLQIKFPRREYAADLVKYRLRFADCEKYIKDIPTPKPNKT